MLVFKCHVFLTSSGYQLDSARETPFEPSPPVRASKHLNVLMTHDCFEYWLGHM